jgi:hypothetical protein
MLVPVREALRRGRFSTVDLLVLTSLDQLLVILKHDLPFLQKKLPQWGGQLYWAFPLVSIPWLNKGWKPIAVFKHSSLPCRILKLFSRMPLALPANNRLGWKSLTGTNTLAYLSIVSFLKKISRVFYNLAQGLMLQIFNGYDPTHVKLSYRGLCEHQCSELLKLSILFFTTISYDCN